MITEPSTAPLAPITKDSLVVPPSTARVAVSSLLLAATAATALIYFDVLRGAGAMLRGPAQIADLSAAVGTLRRRLDHLEAENAKLMRAVTVVSQAGVELSGRHADLARRVEPMLIRSPRRPSTAAQRVSP